MIWNPLVLFIVGMGLFFLHSFYQSKAEYDTSFGYRYATFFSAVQIGYFLCFIASTVLFLLFLR